MPTDHVDFRRREPENLVREHGLDLKLLHPWPGLATPFRGAWCVLRPGDRTDTHQHREQELFIAMAGRAEVVVGERTHVIEAGDLMLMPGDVDHHVLNPHEEDFSYYAIWWDGVMAQEFLAPRPPTSTAPSTLSRAPRGTGPTPADNQYEDVGPAPRSTRLTAESGAKAGGRGTSVIDYNGRRFRKPDSDPHTVAEYHQEGDLVWADFAGGAVRRGSIAGTRDQDGTLHMGYTMVLTNGDVICGHTVNTPEFTAEGRLRLREEWERYGPHAAAGTSYIDEVG